VESWQIFDPDQTLYQQFWNIVNAYDVIADGYNPPPIYFPSTQIFTATTPSSQAAYTLDITVDYNPAQWVGPVVHHKLLLKIVLCFLHQLNVTGL